MIASIEFICKSVMRDSHLVWTISTSLPSSLDNRFAIWARIDYSETDNVCRLNPISTGNVLLNGVAIEEPTELVDRDRLSLGGCEYLFVPLCCGSFRWNNSSQEA